MKNNFFCKILFRLTPEIQAKLFSDYRQNFYRKVVKTILYVFKKQIEETDFSQTFWFYVYSDFNRNLFWFLKIPPRKFVKTAFYEFRRTLWWNRILWKLPIFFYRVVIKNFSDLRKNMYQKMPEPIFRCSENILKKQIFPNVFFVFGTYWDFEQNNFWILGQMFP